MSDPNNPIQFTEYGIPIRNLWHMLVYVWNEPSVRESVKKQLSMGEVESAPSLDALLAILLIKFTQQRMRIGLGRGYVDETKRLRAIRGRINFGASLKYQGFERGEADCEFQKYSANQPRNQIIRSTLARLVQAGQFGPDKAQADALRHRLRWLVRNLDGITLIELSPELIRRQAAAQNEADYRLMLGICELILMRQMPLEAEGGHPTPTVDRDALILHRIYERFVASFYRIHLKGWEVSAQKRLDWHAGNMNEHLPSMVPDLILHETATGRHIVLDTKFTAGSLVENQWGKLVYDSSHLYQLYAYLRSQEQVSDGHRSAMGILLYPAVGVRLSDSAELQGHVIRSECVDLAAAWEEVERQLLGIIEMS